jgi:hypothetical protein
VRVSYIEEVTFGVTPSGNLQTMRLTSESLGQTVDIGTSNELRDDRQISSVKRLNRGAGGSVNIEFAHGDHDDMLEAVLQADSTWSSGATVGPIATIDAASADNSFNDSGSGFGSIGAGEWISVSGFTEAANNGIFKVETATAAKLVVSGGTLTTEAAGDSVTIQELDSITNGKTDKTFSFEKAFLDVSNTFVALRGMSPNEMGLSVAAGEFITGSFTFLGQAETTETSTIGTGYTSAGTDDVTSGVDDVYGFLANDVSTTIQSLNLQITNNMRPRNVVGTLGPESLGSGSISVSGDMTAYFSSLTLLDRYIDFNNTPLAIILQDAEGNIYVFDLPSCKFTTKDSNATGINTDVMLTLGFQAFADATESITVRIARYSVP